LDQICSLIEYMVRGFVDQPEAVTVNAIQQDDGMLYRLAVAPKDFDKVIGKRGRTARSISIILSAIGAKLNRKLSPEIAQ
jgi:uncharacterized protein